MTELPFDVIGAAALVGALISLLVTYIPAVRAWWKGVSSNAKRLIFLLIAVVPNLAVVLLACNGTDVGVVCPTGGFGAYMGTTLDFFSATILSLLGSQVPYVMTNES